MKKWRRNCSRFANIRNFYTECTWNVDSCWMTRLVLPMILYINAGLEPNPRSRNQAILPRSVVHTSPIEWKLCCKIDFSTLLNTHLNERLLIRPIQLHLPDPLTALSLPDHLPPSVLTAQPRRHRPSPKTHRWCHFVLYEIHDIEGFLDCIYNTIDLYLE
jgi:hypothetical protein